MPERSVTPAGGPVRVDPDGQLWVPLADRQALEAENQRLRDGYIDRTDEWPECRYCKAWAPAAEFEHKPGCIVDG